MSFPRSRPRSASLPTSHYADAIISNSSNNNIDEEDKSEESAQLIAAVPSRIEEEVVPMQLEPAPDPVQPVLDVLSAEEEVEEISTEQQQTTLTASDVFHLVAQLSGSVALPAGIGAIFAAFCCDKAFFINHETTFFQFVQCAAIVDAVASSLEKCVHQRQESQVNEKEENYHLAAKIFKMLLIVNAITISKLPTSDGSLLEPEWVAPGSFLLIGAINVCFAYLRQHWKMQPLLPHPIWDTIVEAGIGGAVVADFLVPQKAQGFQFGCSFFATACALVTTVAGINATSSNPCFNFMSDCVKGGYSRLTNKFGQFRRSVGDVARLGNLTEEHRGPTPSPQPRSSI